MKKIYIAIPLAAMMLASYGIGFYLCVLAAIVVAVLPWVKSPILEEKV
jgi:hypothetical protein